MTQSEVWADIEGFPDYKVSTLGRVMSLKGGKESILAGFKNREGHLQVTLLASGIKRDSMCTDL